MLEPVLVRVAGGVWRLVMRRVLQRRAGGLQGHLRHVSVAAARSVGSGRDLRMRRSGVRLMGVHPSAGGGQKVQRGHLQKNTQDC